MDAIRLIAVSLLVVVAVIMAAATDNDAAPDPQPNRCWTDEEGNTWCEPIYESAVQLAGWDAYYTSQSQPAVDLPYELRKQNWGGGSCVHASTITLLRWLADGSGDANLYELAETWPYSGGEYSSRHRSRVEAANLRYVMTVDGDEELIRWAVATRRGCAIAHHGHCYNVVGYDQATGEIITLDNNHTQRYDRTPWSDKISEWQRGGGWAFAFVYDPPVPLPTIR